MRAGACCSTLLRLITADQRHFNRLLRGAVADLGVAAADLGATNAALKTEIEQLRMEVESDERLDAQQAHLDTVERTIGEFGWHIGEIAASLAERDGRVMALEERLVQQQRALDEAHDTMAYLRRRLAERDSRIDVLLSEVGGAHPAAAAAAADVESAGPIVPAAVGADATAAIDDVGFHETFRGDEGTLRSWLQRYVAKFTGCDDVLDVGCGRGEFLELLREAGTDGARHRPQRRVVLRCREKGPRRLQGRRARLSRRLPDGSLGGIFCAQVIEHLPPAAAVRLIQLAQPSCGPAACSSSKRSTPSACWCTTAGSGWT